MELKAKTTTTLKNQMPEKVYRSLKQRLSYSSLKQYDKSRSTFFKENILGLYVEKEETLATLLGSICHLMFADPDYGSENYDISSNPEFDAKFVLSQAEIPTGQMGELIEMLLKRTKQSLDTEGIQTDSFENIFKDAVTNVKYDYNLKEVKFIGKNMETILELFQKPDKKGNIPETYYQEALKNVNKSLVSVNILDKAKSLVDMTFSHPHTSDIMNLHQGCNTEVFREMVILYELRGLEYRSMVDMLHVNHDDQTIQPFDFKITYDVETGFEYTYLKFSYYLQIGLYDFAVRSWALEHDLGAYKVLPMQYIAIDAQGNASPVVYKMTSTDVLMGQRGFSIRGKTYNGVLGIHSELSWNLESGDWATSKKIADSMGKINMNLKYR